MRQLRKIDLASPDAILQSERFSIELEDRIPAVEAQVELVHQIEDEGSLGHDLRV